MNQKYDINVFQASHQHQIIITLLDLAKNLTILQKIKLQAVAQSLNSSRLLTAVLHMIQHTW
jgi:hypothetical protein